MRMRSRTWGSCCNIGYLEAGDDQVLADGGRRALDRFHRRQVNGGVAVHGAARRSSTARATLPPRFARTTSPTSRTARRSRSPDSSCTRRMGQRTMQSETLRRRRRAYRNRRNSSSWPVPTRRGRPRFCRARRARRSFWWCVTLLIVKDIRSGETRTLRTAPQSQLGPDSTNAGNASIIATSSTST